MIKTDICQMTILYITSDQKNIETIGKHLHAKYLHHKLIFACNIIDAIHLLNTRPDISIIDMNIPARFLSVIIKEIPKHNDINQTILINSYNDKVFADYDFKYFLSNPINKDRLCMMIDTIAENIFFKRISSPNH